MNPVGKSNESFFTRQTALWVSGLYLVFGASYIFLSGWIVLQLYDTAEDLARVEMYKGWVFVFSGSLLIFLLIHFASRALRRSLLRQIEAVEQYQRMIETTNEGVWEVDANARTKFINQTMADMLGIDRDSIVGKPEALFLDEQWSAVAVEHLKRQKSGSRDLYECRFRRPDGGELWAMVAASPMRNAQGEFTGVLRMVTDITKRKEMELALKQNVAYQRQLLNELDHRVRNNLASLISLVDISRSTSDDPDSFAASIRGRIDAMSRAHSLLSSSGWKHQDLAPLLRVLVPDVYRSRITFNGPEVQCAANVSGGLAILFHEMLINAVRHGALSMPQGRVEVTWKVDESDGEQRVELHWREIDGPEPPSHVTEGTGLRLVAGLVRADLRGSVSFAFPPTGADHRLTLRIDQTSASVEPMNEAFEPVAAFR